jgi:hypothetical protein
MATTEFKRFRFRSLDNIKKYVKIELAIVKREWKVLLPCVIMQCTSLSSIS